jgi:Protein of unknown function (DUF3007)
LIQQQSLELSSPYFQRSKDVKIMSESPTSSSPDGKEPNKIPFWFDPNTKGGALVLALALFIVPIVLYNILIILFGMDEIEAGIDIGIGFTIISCLAWVSTYVFRVATKDMTYVSLFQEIFCFRRIVQCFDSFVAFFPYPNWHTSNCFCCFYT